MRKPDKTRCSKKERALQRNVSSSADVRIGRLDESRSFVLEIWRLLTPTCLSGTSASEHRRRLQKFPKE